MTMSAALAERGRVRFVTEEFDLEGKRTGVHALELSRADTIRLIEALISIIR